MPRKAVIELHYLPCIDYFSALASYEEVFIEAWEHYAKQTYRNRFVIYDGHRIMKLSVPVKKTTGKIPIREIKIEDRHRALTIHTRAIQSIYGKAPWFEAACSDILAVLLKDKSNLFEMNMEILSICLKLMKIKTKVSVTNTYTPRQEYEESGFEDLRDKIHPKKPLLFKNFPYRQIFGKEFVENLSIIDLLFSEGPHAKNFVAKGYKKELR